MHLVEWVGPGTHDVTRLPPPEPNGSGVILTKPSTVGQQWRHQTVAPARAEVPNQPTSGSGCTSFTAQRVPARNGRAYPVVAGAI